MLTLTSSTVATTATSIPATRLPADRRRSAVSLASDSHSLSRSIDAVARRVAMARCAVLLTGETGTGKGHVARWIHDHSPRAAGPFVPVNCGAIPESLLDSHLFGHAKGAFSGANQDHLGLVRAAAGGTLLLDEINDLPLSAQTRLLRLLEEREVQPVGYSRPVKVDVRIIAATNADLQEAVRSGAFREDLYYRLDVLRLHLAPLRQRIDELPNLIATFNCEFAAMYRQEPLSFAPDAMELLRRHSWPGNVREVRTVVERLHVLCGSHSQPISAEDLGHFAQLNSGRSEVQPGQSASDASQRLRMLKLEAVQQVIEACAGNISRAASTLGVHRSTLYRWLESAKVEAAA